MGVGTLSLKGTNTRLHFRESRKAQGGRWQLVKAEADMSEPYRDSVQGGLESEGVRKETAFLNKVCT